jgi:nitrite reductase/ring-hydroxylating ferredoxin subunit
VGLATFWYAVEHSLALGRSPLPVRLLDKRYILFRDDQGLAHCFLDQCPHRGASFAKGWVDGNCIRCPYHGWSFAPDGHCINIPADQHGTAIVVLAALTNALKIVKKKPEDLKIVMSGAGAAGTAVAQLLYEAGMKNITAYDEG